MVYLLNDANLGLYPDKRLHRQTRESAGTYRSSNRFGTLGLPSSRLEVCQYHRGLDGKTVVNYAQSSDMESQARIVESLRERTS